MIQLLKIEWKKLQGLKAFWLLSICYLVSYVLLVVKMGNLFENMMPGQLGENFYKFPGIWHSASFFAWIFQFIPAVLIIMYVCNEFSYRTYRQHLIDGMSKARFLMGKLMTVKFFSLLICLLVFASVMVLGKDVEGVSRYDNIEFIAVLFLNTMTFLMFATFLAILTRKTGFAMAILMLYCLILEPVLAAYLPSSQHLFLPFTSMYNAIPFPRKSILFGGEYSIQSTPIISTGVFFVVFLFSTYAILKKRDA